MFAQDPGVAERAVKELTTLIAEHSECKFELQVESSFYLRDIGVHLVCLSRLSHNACFHLDTCLGLYHGNLQRTRVRSYQ